MYSRFCNNNWWYTRLNLLNPYFIKVVFPTTDCDRKYDFEDVGKYSAKKCKVYCHLLNPTYFYISTTAKKMYFDTGSP